MTVILLELNELNIEAVNTYVEKGLLPEFARLIRDHGVSETTSEVKYENIEPWIQWVTAHTGLDFDDHGVFRLGDIRGSRFEQIWEQLEQQGISVGAISPMNAENRCKEPAFFVPDPWVQGRVTGPWLMRQLYKAIVQAVNDNAQAKLTAGSVLYLALGLVGYARLGSIAEYRRLIAATLRKNSWSKALVLDRLLADVFLREMRKRKPGFASLFLNAAAHIQHHYMFSSDSYEGPFKNPEWYVSRNEDPILDVFRLYDRVVADIRRGIPDARIILATGLHQVPHGDVTFYWRIKQHAAFLAGLDISFDRVEPRMSRDFVLVCNDKAAAKEAEYRLGKVQTMDHVPLFSVDNRGQDLFVTFTWPHDIPADFEYRVGNEVRNGLKDQVAFVAIKNGEHDGVGYLIDTGVNVGGERFPLREIPQRIADACGVSLAA